MNTNEDVFKLDNFRNFKRTELKRIDRLKKKLLEKGITTRFSVIE